MILTDREIRAALASGEISIVPSPEPDQFSPSALDLRLGEQFRRWRQPPVRVDVVPDPSPPGVLAG